MSRAGPGSLTPPLWRVRPRSLRGGGELDGAGDAVVVVVGEHLGDELAAAPDGGLLVDRLQVVLDGVAREVQLQRDLVRRQAAGERARDVDLARGQLVGLDDE